MWSRIQVAVALWALINTVAYCQEHEVGGEAEAGPNIVLENDHVRYVVGANGRNLSFLDKHTGTEYCAQKGNRALVTLKKGTAWYEPTACIYADGRLSFQFHPPGITAVLKAACRKHYFVFEVESISDPDVDELLLPNLAVTSSQYVSGMSGVASDDDFAACLRALNLQTLLQVGGNPPVFSSRCYRKYAVAGAKLALVGCPKAEIRAVLKEVVREEGSPYSPLGGPYALDAEETRGSYVFAGVSQQNVDQWIALAKKAGIVQIHFIGWEHSLGHYQPRKDLFPGGLAGLKAAVEKIHAAGLKAGMHTLTGCISPHDPWVTPVPEKRLAADATFTLAAPLDEKQTTVLAATYCGSTRS